MSRVIDAIGVMDKTEMIAGPDYVPVPGGSFTCPVDTVQSGIRPFSEIKHLLHAKPIQYSKGVSAEIEAKELSGMAKMISESSSFEFLNDPAEDIYGPGDGEPL